MSKTHRSLIDQQVSYVSRAAYKLESVTQALKIDFNHKTVLDVGSSTGGFTQYALLSGASKVIAVDKGTNQLSPLLRDDERIELHEKTDINNLIINQRLDLILIDVSFVSLKDVLPSIIKLATKDTIIIAMAKPQFETDRADQKHHGIIKNERIRRDILTNLELWLKKYFVILNKSDSSISGLKGNKERFYKLITKT